MRPRLAQVATEVGSIRRESSPASMRPQLATLVRDSSVTAHCPAAPALPTREYQADHRRQSLTSGATCATPLDISFHIRGAAERAGLDRALEPAGVYALLMADALPDVILDLGVGQRVGL